MIIDTIARRYANALADTIIESDEEATVKAELKTWEELLKANTEMRTLVNPTIDHKLKQNVLEELISRTRPTPTTANFLRVLIKNKRLRVLSEINSELSELLALSPRSP